MAHSLEFGLPKPYRKRWELYVSKKNGLDGDWPSYYAMEDAQEGFAESIVKGLQSKTLPKGMVSEAFSILGDAYGLEFTP